MSKRKVAEEPVLPGIVGALLKEVKAVEKAGFIVDLDETNARRWQISVVPSMLKAHGLLTLVQDLKVWARNARKPVAIVMEINFAASHPHEPPFVRVVRPRFTRGTGHVTVGGSLCTKLLTTDGWRNTMSVEAIVRSLMENFNDGNARIEVAGRQDDYSLAEAMAAFKRSAIVHGWASHVATFE